jgi:hypothetical protein
LLINHPSPLCWPELNLPPHALAAGTCFACRRRVYCGIELRDPAPGRRPRFNGRKISRVFACLFRFGAWGSFRDLTLKAGSDFTILLAGMLAYMECDSC